MTEPYMNQLKAENPDLGVIPFTVEWRR